MKALRLSENVVSITEFKAKAPDWLQKLADTQEPVVITQHGQAAAVLLSPKAYDELTENLRFVKAVGAGFRNVRDGRTSAHEEVRERLLGRVDEP